MPDAESPSKSSLGHSKPYFMPLHAGQCHAGQRHSGGDPSYCHGVRPRPQHGWHAVLLGRAVGRAPVPGTTAATSAATPDAAGTLPMLLANCHAIVDCHMLPAINMLKQRNKDDACAYFKMTHENSPPCCSHHQNWSCCVRAVQANRLYCSARLRTMYE